MIRGKEMMNVQVSKCYYHVDRPAVAVCQQCGVGICKECAVKDDLGRVICYKCGNSKREHKEYRELLKQQGGRFRSGKEFILPGIIGILIDVIGGIMSFFGGAFNNITWQGTTIIAFIIIAYTCFSIPFCMIILNDRFAPRYDTLYNRCWLWILKLYFSLLVGWIVFFYLIRFIVIKSKGKRGNIENE